MGSMQNLTLKTATGNILLNELNVIRIESSSNYSKIFFIDNKYVVVAKVLKWFEAVLPQSYFMRIHQSHLVNKNFIKYVNTRLDNCVCMTTGESIQISRRKKKNIHDLIHLG